MKREQLTSPTAKRSDCWPISWSSLIMPTAAAQNNLRVAWAQLQKVSAEGEILTQWDDLGVIANSWQTGDVLVQKHIFAGREEMAASQYEVWVGLYNPETGRRWQTAEGKDRVLLETIEVVR